MSEAIDRVNYVLRGKDMPTPKGLKTAIIKKHGSALNLISEQHSAVFVTGIPHLADDELEENSANLPVVVLTSGAAGWRAEPVGPPSAGNLGWFPGGNYLAIEIDGQPLEVPMYDRQETPEEYALFSS
jgi:hypothetical protein